MTALICVLGVLTALLCIRVGLLVRWSDKLELWVCWLFLRIPLKRPVENAEKLATEEEKKAKKAAEQKLKKKSKKEGEPRALEDIIAMVLDLAGSATGALRMLLRNLRVSGLNLRVTVAEGDAAETAIQYGRMSAYIYGAYATLQSMVKMKRTRIDIQPDFCAEEGGFTLRFRVSLMPIAVIGAAGLFAAKFLWKTVRRGAEENQPPEPPNPENRPPEAQMAAHAQGKTGSTGSAPDTI